MTAPDLKPCPFCGSKAAVWTTDAYSGDSAEHVLGCTSCNIYMPFAGVFNSKVPTQDDVTAWNTRSTSLAEALAVPEVKALVEAASPLMSMAMWTETAEDTEMVIVSIGTVRRIRAALRAIGEGRNG